MNMMLSKYAKCAVCVIFEFDGFEINSLPKDYFWFKTIKLLHILS